MDTEGNMMKLQDKVAIITGGAVELVKVSL